MTKSFNVCMYDINKKEFVYYDVIPYLREKYISKKTKYNWEEMKDFIRSYAMYQWWARCEYEIIISDWPREETKKKVDIYYQIMMNLDVITDIMMNYDN